MSQKSLWTFKLIIKVLFLKLQPILWCTHPPKKTNFYKVTKLTVCNILLTREKYLVTPAVNRPTCSQPLCAILCNSLHYCPCYGKTRVWRYNVYFWLSGQRVKRVKNSDENTVVQAENKRLNGKHGVKTVKSRKKDNDPTLLSDNNLGGGSMSIAKSGVQKNKIPLRSKTMSDEKA